MILFKQGDVLQRYLREVADSGKSIGFVPTMGALHNGHEQLIRECKKKARCCVVSIFVNPTQFNDPRDFEKYPSSIENDIRMLEANGTDILFLPSVFEIYPAGTDHLEQYDLGYLETVLEGKYRPGHFQGVCQVMERLLNIVKPARLFMGQKDFQQCLVIRKLLKLRSFGTELIIHPTVRENDGLAMSSRNRRLDHLQRKNATAIFHALRQLQQKWKNDQAAAITSARYFLDQHGFRVEYIEIANSNTLELQRTPSTDPEIALIAAYLGEIRLIDNLTLTP